jgi:hypothetical protein
MWSAILYIALIIATRMMGHRQVSILSGHNYLVAAGIVSLAAVRMLTPESSLISGLVIVFVYTVNVLLTEYRICKNIYGTSKDEILEILHFIYKNKKYIDGGGTQVFEGNYDELENIMEKRLKEVIHGY